LIGRIAWDPKELETVNEAYNEVGKKYLDAFTRAAPGIDEEKIHRAFQFLLAAMYSACADNRRIDSLSDGRYSSRDLERIYEIIVPFLTGGFMALDKDNKR
jgi:hypothetical protein